MKKLTKAGKLLNKAAALIEKNGHCKHTYAIGKRLCIFGAINMASYGKAGYYGQTSRIDRDACKRLAKVIAGQDVVAWNDNEKRRKSEVVAKLREAARL